ncbi:unnamed protein product [Caenorhabditis auriculariae]|uniref:SXP/RAL-2 family protein Ani s 5-like cation-binding domain-containing protein n=1 Tax=Caenorhabditis auriculariae TaxID=2777116 RepID=A0A8S1HTE3_9PELO|nr:unnamed protein product [Caenorhabditis auriculariae]
MSLHQGLLVCALFALAAVEARHGAHGAKFPPFLANVSDAARRDFFTISRNPNLTISQEETQLSAWASTNGVVDTYNQFIANVTARQTQLSQNVSAVIGNLAAAKQAVDAVMNNKEQTRAQQRATIEELRTRFPQEIPTLFFIGKVLDGPKSHENHGPRGGPGGHGGHGRPEGRPDGPRGGHGRNY